MKALTTSKVSFAELMATLKPAPQAPKRLNGHKRPQIGTELTIPEGNRNSTLCSLAGSMRRRGFSQTAIAAALEAENQSRCDPPLDDEEVEQIVESICRYEPNEAASQPVQSRAELGELIASTDDFDELTGSIAARVNSCELKEVERDSLRKAIAKKADVSVASLKQDAKRGSQRTSKGTFDHLDAARNVIATCGQGNLIHAQGYLWRWRNDGVWRHADDREIKQTIHKIADVTNLTANIVGSVLDMVKTESHVNDVVFNSTAESINCRNGELTLLGGAWALQPHDRDHFHTSMIPVAFDPKAAAPRFRQFLDEIFACDSDAEEKTWIVLEAMGYTLTTNCRLEKFFMLIGGGANGKSVLLFVLAELVGRAYVCAVQPSQFENQFQRGHLQNRLANIITEIAEGAEVADAQLKSLVSGEMTTAEHKHKDPFDFVPYAKHWFGTNHLPHTRDFSDALFRRAIILTFNNKFEGANRDVHLADKLKNELPGILNLALAGLKRLRENNAFTECASGVEIILQWRKEADQVAQFVEESCDVDPSLSASVGDMYRDYKDWAQYAGIKGTLNKNNFVKRLVRLGYMRDRGTGGDRRIKGLRPKMAGNT